MYGEVRELAEIAGVSELEASIFWAIGKSHPEAGAQVMMEILERREAGLSPESAYQLFIALRDLLEGLEVVEIGERGRRVLESYARSGDSRLAERAECVLGLVGKG
jgi:hypothetical protein